MKEWVAALCKVFADAIAAAIQTYGPGVIITEGLLVAAVVFLYRDQRRQWMERLKEKNAEIHALAEKIKWYEEAVLTKRLSSGLRDDRPPQLGKGGDTR